MGQVRTLDIASILSSKAVGNFAALKPPNCQAANMGSCDQSGFLCLLVHFHNPKVPTDTTSTMAASHLPWLDNAKQDKTRNKFLECIAAYLPEISPRVWAFAVVAPVDKLSKLIDSLDAPMAELFCNSLDGYIKTALDVWKQRGTKDEPADEDNDQPARKKRKTTSEATGQPRDTRDKSLVAHVRRKITDFLSSPETNRS